MPFCFDHLSNLIHVELDSEQPAAKNQQNQSNNQRNNDEWQYK